MRLLPIAVATALLAAPAAARAAEVVSEPAQDLGCHKGFCEQRPASLTFRAASGEVNAVTLTQEGSVYTVRDTGAGVAAGQGCTQIDPQTARCENLPAGVSVSVDLGDGDDRVSAPLGQPVSLSGGAGADSLDGGSAGDQLSPGPGADTVHGGEGADALIADAGEGGENGPMPAGSRDDRFDGGGGVDRLLYLGRREPLEVDLAAGTGGESGERDAITGVEDVAGGDGADKLTGDAGANGLTGGQGDDVLRGGDGADRLSGGYGDDTLDGGAGDDVLSDDGPVAAGGCGDGADRFDPFGPGTPLVRPDCELVGLGMNAIGEPALGARPLRRTRRSLVYAVSCAASGGCGIFLDVRTVGRPRVRVAGTGRVVPAGTSRIAVRLTKQGRRLLRRRCPRLKMTGRGGEAGSGWRIPKRIAAEPEGPPWCGRVRR
ncbi:MAG TPA: calcium-binding protein [Solirubrobacteraceae bacterium]